MQMTVGPVAVATVRGDFYEALARRLGELGLTWAQLADEMSTTRQNLQRMLRLQAALRVENVIAVLSAVRKLAGETGELDLGAELSALGVAVRGAGDNNVDAALKQAAALNNRGRRHGKG